eukprot:COSAG01_NODE_2758_length_7121_cov_64.907434_2_plen_210_part_00
MGNCRRAVRVPCTSSGFRQLPRNRRENTLGLQLLVRTYIFMLDSGSMKSIRLPRSINTTEHPSTIQAHSPPAWRRHPRQILKKPVFCSLDPCWLHSKLSRVKTPASTGCLVPQRGSHSEAEWAVPRKGACPAERSLSRAGETHYFLSRVKIPPFTAPTTIPVHVRSKESLVLDVQVPRIASPTREGLLFIWPQGAHGEVRGSCARVFAQ